MAHTVISKLPDVGTTIFTVMSQLATETGALNLSQGFPSFDPPAGLTKRISWHLEHGANQYAPMPGIPALREAIAEKTARLQGRMLDINTEFVEKGLANITKILTRSVDKGKISAQDKDAILGRIKITADLSDMADADFVVEAATENEKIKFEIFRTLDEVCPPDAILSTNTSSIPVCNSV